MRYTMGPHIPGWEDTVSFALERLRESLGELWDALADAANVDRQR